MKLANIDLTEEFNMEFEVQAFGTVDNVSKVFLVIENSGFNIEIPAKVNNGIADVVIPKLKGIIDSGLKECHLRVELSDKVFYPLREQLEINPLIEFDVKTKKVASVKEGVKVSVKKQVVSEDTRTVEPGPTKLEKNIQKCITEGYEVSKIGEHYVMKKGELYAGLISEAKILKAKKLHETLTEMIDSLA
jgi:hypothetical protein